MQFGALRCLLPESLTRQGLQGFSHILVDQNCCQLHGMHCLGESVGCHGVCPVVQGRPTRKLNCDMALHCVTRLYGGRAVRGPRSVVA